MRGSLAICYDTVSEQRHHEAALDCPIRFAGQWEDAESGLYYNRYRYYDPLTGQYLSPDPIGLAGGLRPNGYVHNPIAWTDPLGLACCVTQPKYVYDAQTGRYRDTQTGQFVAARNLPWPSDGGFVAGTRGPNILQPGKIVDRYGTSKGSYLGEPGYTPSQRGMVSGTESAPYSRYEVVKPIHLESGTAASVPEFGAKGGAPQHYTGQMTVQDLLDQGYLRILP